MAAGPFMADWPSAVEEANVILDRKLTSLEDGP